MGKVQFLQSGDSPMKTSAKLDLPTPVAPRITIFGSTNISSFSEENNLKCVVNDNNQFLDDLQ